MEGSKKQLLVRHIWGTLVGKGYGPLDQVAEMSTLRTCLSEVWVVPDSTANVKYSSGHVAEPHEAPVLSSRDMSCPAPPVVSP